MRGTMSGKKKGQNGGPRGPRENIAMWVLGGTFGGLIALSIAMICAAGSEDRGEAAEKVFTMVLPMVGTWVGTVLAYYFSGEAYEKASESLTDSVRKLTDQKLASIPVREAMIPKTSMIYVSLPARNGAKKVNLKTELIDKLKPPVTRLPVLDPKGVVKYIIHQSLIFKFISEKTFELGAAFDAGAQTLEDFLAHADMRQMVSRSIATVGIDATLAKAKQEMEDTDDSQDVFVTDTGKPDRPVLGWLTNIMIAKHAKA
jgi:hypothetical protein